LQPYLAKTSDLLDVYNIVFQKKSCFKDQDPEEGQLEEETTVDGNKIKTMNPFDNYLKLTPEQVALSLRYYSVFVPEANCYYEDLDWSLAYYEKNVEPDLFTKVHGTMLKYDPDSQGGPLFLKLLLDRVSTSGDSTLKALVRLL
jgi:hypothetical protein